MVSGLVGLGAPVSIDTSKGAVAEAALDAGATIVNDVTALRAEPELAALCADRGATVVLMHMQGDPRTMQADPAYDDVVDDVKAFLAERIEVASAAGVATERIWLDPGIGFGKTLEHNLELLRRLDELRGLGRPWSSARRARASSARSTAPTPRTGSAARSPPRSRRRPGRRRAPSPRRRRDRPGRPGRGRDPRVGSAAMEAHGNGIESSVEVEIRRLSIYTHHGVGDAEQEVGQRLEFDITFDVPDCDAVLTDRIEDTVDYGEVCDIVALAATERSYRTLERLAQVVGTRLMERFNCESVRVRAAKPEPPLPLAIQEVAVEVMQERSEEEVEGEEE